MSSNIVDNTKKPDPIVCFFEEGFGPEVPVAIVDIDTHPVNVNAGSCVDYLLIHDKLASYWQDIVFRTLLELRWFQARYD
jgi:hypothetical protein